MNYNLNQILSDNKKEKSTFKSFVGVFKMLPKGETKNISLAIFALLVNGACTLIGPYIIGRTIDVYVAHKDISGLLYNSILLAVVFIVALISNFLQIRIMGGVGQRTLFSLRNKIFKKIQELPLAFFNQNKAGDLIARINGDTEKLSTFFSETLTRLFGSVVMIGGAAALLLIVNLKLGAVTLLPAIIIWIFTYFIASFVSKSNSEGLKSSGLLSAEIQESIQNFKVIVAFDRRDYFRERFKGINEANYKAGFKAGLWNGIFSPMYDLAANIGQFIVLVYGIYLISQGALSLGILVSFLAYEEKFYSPLRQLAQLWSTAQVSIAALGRIQVILSLESDLLIMQKTNDAHLVNANPAGANVVGGAETKRDVDGVQGVDGVQNVGNTGPVIKFDNVAFHYADAERPVLSGVNINLEKGKTYALVGPTGGGKTTTASIMARLYDPTEGAVYLNGQDIRVYRDEERANRIGFILQEPIVFAGTVGENIMYGNDSFAEFGGSDESMKKLETILEKENLSHLLSTFENGVQTMVPKNIDAMSLGQRQILAFMRAVLRKPDVLILDEATANIDTVTEQILEEILRKLPSATTKVIIAHRLNTIKDADVIYFVNGGTVTEAGSMENAIEMLLHVKKGS